MSDKKVIPMDQIKTGTTLGKTIMRNGFDAYAINAPLQKMIIEKTGILDVDLACSCDPETLLKIFPNAELCDEDGAMVILNENGVTMRFYPADVEDASHPERGQLRVTPRMLRLLQQLEKERESHAATEEGEYAPFENFDSVGCVMLKGIPSVTLSYDYLLAIRALRCAANFDLPIDPATWISIVQAANRILDYVPARSIMEEWHKVAAESMWRFVKLLFEAHILHGIMPEVAALACVKQQREDNGTFVNVFDLTVECMRLYPQAEGLSMDWYGTLATLFHNVGKLYTAEYINGTWTFYQHHRVGAGVTRKILRRLHFTPENIDLICHLVRYHMMFHFMLTDRGLRRFKALGETERLIAICRADIEATGGKYTSYNHNMKYLERVETAEILLEPLLNGNEIMECTNLEPGPAVGILRHALLKAQKAGEVTDVASATEFVQKLAEEL